MAFFQFEVYFKFIRGIQTRHKDDFVMESTQGIN